MINKLRLKQIKHKLSNYPFFEFIGKGRRGIIYKISSKLIVKIERDDIKTFNVIKNEFNVLKRIKKYEYFPNPIKYDENLRFLIREFVPGELIGEHLSKEVILECLKMCKILDGEGINQQELTNPFKHIFVHNGKVMMIDFERAKLSKKPKNVSQFVQYLIKKLKIQNDELRKLTKNYKLSYSYKDFNKIVLFFFKSDFIH